MHWNPQPFHLIQNDWKCNVCVFLYVVYTPQVSLDRVSSVSEPAGPKNAARQPRRRPLHSQRAAQPDDPGWKLPQRASSQRPRQPQLNRLAAGPRAPPLHGRAAGPLPGQLQTAPQPQLAGQLQPGLAPPALSKFHPLRLSPLSFNIAFLWYALSFFGGRHKLLLRLLFWLASLSARMTCWDKCGLSRLPAFHPPCVLSLLCLYVCSVTVTKGEIFPVKKKKKTNIKMFKNISSDNPDRDQRVNRTDPRCVLNACFLRCWMFLWHRGFSDDTVRLNIDDIPTHCQWYFVIFTECE